MSAVTEQSLAGAIKFDLRLMHETWMEFLFPRQRGAANTVLGKWEPQNTSAVIGYRLWSALGVPLVAILYPLVLFGYFVRFQTRRINLTAARLGFGGVVGLFVLLWGGLATAVYFELVGNFTESEILAIVASSGVAIVSAALSYLFWRLDGRPVTVIFAYPFAMTAIFLPPIVAALFSGPIAEIVVPPSDRLSSWLFETGPDVITDPLGEQFDRQEYHYVIIWFGISIPIGWILGTLVTLADLIRPTGE
jgi:hypothetical protein